MLFVKLNLGRKTFTGHDFFTGDLVFENLKQIPYTRANVIIYTGNGNNVHPSHWLPEWFSDEQLNYSKGDTYKKVSRLHCY